MDFIQAEAVLRRFNDWRRYDGPPGRGPQMPDPSYIGEAIDIACEVLMERIGKKTDK